MLKADIDLAVLLIFFARPSTLSEVFEKVKEARPSKLFLFCDGARNESDLEKISICKNIVSDINWECEVYTNYLEKNKGCGEGPASAISWAFDYVDKLLILEDDCVANATLFPFMKEMLDKYENDSRVGIISGFNHFCEWNAGEDSYFFTKCGATLGWGTWRRVWENYDYHLENMKNNHISELLKEEIINKRAATLRVAAWNKCAFESKNKKLDYWDIQFGFVKYSQSYLCIVPKYNLVYNIGVGVGSTHTAGNKYEKWKPGKILFMPTRNLEFPLKHPNYFICDRIYDEKCFKLLYPNKLIKLIKRIKRRVFK